MSKSVHTYAMYDAVKRLDLKQFIEREAGASFEKVGQTWKCSCPLHKEGKPSFTLKVESNGVWIFHCWGCDAKGTIIDFCKTFFSEPNPWKAAILAADKEGLKLDESVIRKAMENASVQDDRQKSAMLAHFEASYACLKLLRACKGDGKVMSWVAKAYQAMNGMLDDEGTRPEAFRTVRSEACHMLEQLANRENQA